MSRVQCDVERFEFILTQAGNRAVRGVSSMMHEEAQKIAELAIQFAPRDKENLEDAITVGRLDSGRDSRGRFVKAAWGVWVDGSHEAGANKTVADYWILMHEGLAPYGSGAYQLGPGSRAKGGDVGGKFMERAFVEREATIYQRAFWEVQKSLGSI